MLTVYKTLNYVKAVHMYVNSVVSQYLNLLVHPGHCLRLQKLVKGIRPAKSTYTTLFITAVREAGVARNSH
jgi:hypothetical protein